MDGEVVMNEICLVQGYRSSYSLLVVDVSCQNIGIKLLFLSPQRYHACDDEEYEDQ